MANNDSFASYFDDSFTVDDINDDIAKLKDALKNLSINFEVEHLMDIFEKCLSSCSRRSLDEKIFRETLPAAYHFMFELIERIQKTLNADVEVQSSLDIKQQLSMCHELLDIWQKCLEHVKRLCTVPVNDVKSLLETVLEVVKLIFEHCKVSSQIYGSLFDGVSKELTNLFRKANAILRLFLATLEGVIVFDTDTESETELLVKVIGTIGSIAAMTKGMDFKTFVEVTKVFSKLAVTYQSQVKRVSATCIISHLQQLSKDVCSTVSTLKDSRASIDEKVIKGTGLLLKILDRMFATYSSYIDNEILLSAIEILLNMHRCSPSCLKLSQIEEGTIDLINIHVYSGTEPLLNTFFKNPAFKKAYFDYGQQSDIDKLSYHMLTLSIMKRLIKMPYEHNCKWTLGVDSILDVTLTNINAVQEEIFAGELRLPGAREIGERSRSVTLYEATLVPICCLISQVPTDGFHAIELLLLKHLLSNQFWSSLLSMDTWCFISRLGSTDLCVSHVKYLLKVYAVLSRRQHSLEVISLENLIGRLYALLPEETKHSLVIDLEDVDTHLWIPLARYLPLKTKLFLRNRLACTLNEISSVYAELNRQATVENWNRLLTLVTVMGKLNCIENKGIVDILSQMWSTIGGTIEDFEGRHLDLLSDFIVALLNATRADSMQDEVFLQILDAVVKSFLCFPPHLRAITAHRLRNSVDAFDNCGLKTANLLAELNCRLLEDENPWVRQEALESFDCVAHTCPNESLVTRMAAAITKKSSISDFLPAYLSGIQYYELRDYQNVRHYLRELARHYENIGHICRRYDDSPRNEKFARMDSHTGDENTRNDRPSSFSLDDHLDERIHKICDELNDVLRKGNDIGKSALRRLRLVCEKFLTSHDEME